jgi:Sulfatase
MKRGVTFWLQRLPLEALLAAEATALAGALWSTPAGLTVTTLLLYLPALLLAGAVAATRYPVSRTCDLVHVWLGRRFGLGLGRVLFLAALLSALVPTGWWWAIRHVVDVPFGRHALLAYFGSLVLSSLIVLGVARLLSSKPAPRRPWSWSTWAVIGLAGGLCDGFILPREQLEYHYTMLPLTLLALVVASARAPRRVSWASPLVLAAYLLVGRAQPGEAFSAIAGKRSMHQRVLRISRWLVDRDGDGFSAYLGGGDCDDHDPKSYPLSLEGRDCTGWSRDVDDTAHEHRPVAPSADAPKTILLLTVDAFRCSLAGETRPELRSSCPSVEKLAQAGWSRADAHTAYASTPYAVPIMQTGNVHSTPDHPLAGATYLASTLSSAGYHSHVISTHWNVLRNNGVRASFDSIDESLEPIARAPQRVTSELVTDHLLAQLDKPYPRAFIWAHYYDPHAPYLTMPGDELETSPLDAYLAELRRTDAALRRLFAALQARPDADRIFVVLTADHGEEFGEHDTSYHGANLYEQNVHVPFIAWSPGREPRRWGAALPVSTSQVGAYLISVVTGAAFASQPYALMQSDAFEDPQVGVYSDGWKLIFHVGLNFTELYDLRSDPGERRDLSRTEPTRVNSLEHLLAQAWAVRPTPLDATASR